MFILKRERDRVWAGEGQRERHRIWSRFQSLSCQPRAQCGAQTHKPWDHDLSQSQTPNQLSHPGSPLSLSKTKAKNSQGLQKQGESEKLFLSRGAQRDSTTNCTTVLHMESQNRKRTLGRRAWVAHSVKHPTWLGSWSHSLWVWAPHKALCWQLRAWSLFQILCLSLCPSPAHALSLSVSKINKNILKSFLN